MSPQYSSTTVLIPIATVARKPELRMLGEKGTPKVEFLVAVDRGYGRDSGTDWFSITGWNRTAELCAEHLDKGSRVSITGHLRGDFFEAKDGGTRRSTDIVADSVQFLSRPRTNGVQPQVQGTSPK